MRKQRLKDLEALIKMYVTQKTVTIDILFFYLEASIKTKNKNQLCKCQDREQQPIKGQLPSDCIQEFICSLEIFTLHP